MLSKNLFKISKNLILELTDGKYIDDSVNLVPEYRDYNKCKKTCPFFEVKDDFKFCKNECVFVLSTSSLLSQRKKYLTFTQIKQLLFYNASVFENNGITRTLTNKEIAKAINVTERTVRDNLKALMDKGYLALAHVENHEYKVMVCDFHKYFNESKQGGYININKYFLKALMKLKSFNALRIALYALIKVDNMRVGNAKRPVKVFSYKSLINMLPSNINNANQIKALFLELKNIFNFTFASDSISVSFHSRVDSLIYNERITKKNRKSLNKAYKENEIVLTIKDKLDMLQMSMQYGISIITKVLEYAKQKNYPCYPDYIRTLVQAKFDEFILN